MKTNVLNQVSKSASKRVSSKSDIEVPKRGRKLSVKAKKTCEGEGIDTSSLSISLLAFLPLFGLFESLRIYYNAHSSGRGGFKADYFVLFILVAMGCSVVKGGRRVRGVSVSYLCRMLYSGNVTPLNSRVLNHRLLLLVDSGLLSRVRSVSSSGYFIYSISIHAEKLLLSKISKKELLGLNGLVRSML